MFSGELRTNWLRKNLLKGFVLWSIVFLFLFSWYGDNFDKSRSRIFQYSKKKKGDDDYYERLSLPHCKIPRVSTYSQKYDYDYDRIQFESCDGEDKFSAIEKGILRLESKELSSKCCASEIFRPFKLPSDAFIQGQCVSFNDSKTMDVSDKEFISVSCTSTMNKSNKSLTRINFHANVIPTADYLRGKTDYWKRKEIPLNVLVLVLDSTTRTDAFRQLPKTMNYLINELNFVNFKGFHHLGEPTMLNAIPLLFGVPEPKFFQNKTWESHWDDLPFIWNIFSQSNYATAYIEDLPSLGTFNYGGQKGFTFKPTDFYLRPFFLATRIQSGQKACVGKSRVDKFILEYQLEMLKKMNGLVPVFSMPWLCWPQHDYVGTLYQLENTILEFFQNLSSELELLENTLTIVMADHGFYNGPYANSHDGLLERRLPLFLIRLPAKLKKKYPEFADRIQENSQRITSHHDVYKTFLHLAQLASPEAESVLKNNVQQLEGTFGRSLFEFIHENRTCRDAGIPANGCACNLPPPPVNRTDQVPSIMKIILGRPG